MTSKEITEALRDGLSVFGPEKLRIQLHKIRTHSIRSGAAMAMYLGGVPVFAIQIIGCWSSDAFMKYIRKQIDEFTNIYALFQPQPTIAWSRRKRKWRNGRIDAWLTP
jgi:hypothetical protein